MKANKLNAVLGTKYPIIAGGMAWTSGWRLVSAVSNAGGLGVLGAGTMDIPMLREHIKKTKEATNGKPYGVNLPVNKFVTNLDKMVEVVIEEKVPIVFTSAGNPSTLTSVFQKEGIKVGHVAPTTALAMKCATAGVDVVVTEGFEAGGHCAHEEITVLTMIRRTRAHLPPEIPLVAAGGIASGEAIYAVMALGADGAQLGTRFALTQESSMHIKTRELCAGAPENATMMALKKLMPARLLLNDYGKKALELCRSGASAEELWAFSGRGKTRMGMSEGDLVNGEIEIGQITTDCGGELPTAQHVVETLVAQFNARAEQMEKLRM